MHLFCLQFYRHNGIEWPTVTVEYRNLNVSMEVSVGPAGQLCQHSACSKHSSCGRMLSGCCHLCQWPTVQQPVEVTLLPVRRHAQALGVYMLYARMWQAAVGPFRPECSTSIALGTCKQCARSETLFVWVRLCAIGAGRLGRSAHCWQCPAASSQGEQLMWPAGNIQSVTDSYSAALPPYPWRLRDIAWVAEEPFCAQTNTVLRYACS